MHWHEFSLLFKDEFFYNEFKEEFERIDEQTLDLLSTNLRIFIEDKERKNSLYYFALFLFNLIYVDWSGYLSPDLIYLTTKGLVIAGLRKEAEKVSVGLEFHPGCCSWRLGSFYRNKNVNPRDIAGLMQKIEIFLENPEIKQDPLIRNDLLTWYIAFKQVDLCFQYYEAHKDDFTRVFPYIILIERLILDSKLNKIEMILMNLESINSFTSYERVLLNNKKAVWYQLKGDQKNSLEWFDRAERLAIELGDFNSASKINFNQGSSYFLIDEYELSLQFYQKAETLYKNLNDEIGVGKCYNGLSTVYNAIGEYAFAEKYIELAKAIFENSNQTTMSAGLSYKHALILNVKGEYEKALQIIDGFDLKERSILNFEVRLLKLAITFELSRELDLLEIDDLLETADLLGYSLGEANVFIETSKMFLLRGDITLAKDMLNKAYKLFHGLNNHRGVVRSLTLNALVELFNNNFMEAENYCNISIEQAKNSNFYLEEKEASIILSNIFYLKNQKSKAMNLMDAILYSFETKKIKNNYLLQALLNKCHFRHHNSNSILKQDIVDFIRQAKTSGSYYWINQSQLQEAEDLLQQNNYSNAKMLASEVKKMTKNYDIRFFAEKIIIKSSIALLESISLDENKELEKINLKFDIERNFDRLKKELSDRNLVLHLLELEIIKLYYYKTSGKILELKTELEKIKHLAEEKGLSIYLQEISAFERKNEITNELFALDFHVISLVLT